MHGYGKPFQWRIAAIFVGLCLAIFVVYHQALIADVGTVSDHEIYHLHNAGTGHNRIASGLEIYVTTVWIDVTWGGLGRCCSFLDYVFVQQLQSCTVQITSIITDESNVIHIGLIKNSLFHQLLLSIVQGLDQSTIC